jgi:ATP-dependent protease ClpP protease subunit
MRKDTNTTELIPLSVTEPSIAVLPSRARTVRYIGGVSRIANERILAKIEKLLDVDAVQEIALFITSPGGPSGSAMSFYDSVRHMLKPNLVTVGSGEVDSSGIIIFLSGYRRYVTKRTTFLFHCAGRIFGAQRYTAAEMAAMLAEDTLKDEHYASVVADNSGGKLTPEDVLQMMKEQTVLSADDFVKLGLADGVLA